MLGNRSGTRGRSRWTDAGRGPGLALDEQATELGRRARRQGRRWADRAERSLNTRRKRFGRGLENLGVALERRSKQLRRQDGVTAAAGRMVYRAGTVVEDAGEFIRTHDLQELGREAGALVRRRPLLIVGLAAGVGLALGSTFGSLKQRREQRRREELRREQLRRQAGAAASRHGLRGRLVGRRRPEIRIVTGP